MSSHYVLKIQYVNKPPETRNISARVTTIGREAGDIVLGDPQSSGRHAEIYFENGNVRVKDLGSTNGTFFNGQRAPEFAMAAGQGFSIGQTVMTLMAVHGAAGRAGAGKTMLAMGGAPVRPPGAPPPPGGGFGGPPPGAPPPPAGGFGGPPPGPPGGGFGGPPPGAPPGPPGGGFGGPPPGPPGGGFGGPPPGAPPGPPGGGFGGPPPGAPPPGGFGGPPPSDPGGFGGPPPGGPPPGGFGGPPPGGPMGGPPPGGPMGGPPPGGPMGGPPPGGPMGGPPPGGPMGGPPMGAPPGGMAPMGAPPSGPGYTGPASPPPLPPAVAEVVDWMPGEQVHACITADGFFVGANPIAKMIAAFNALITKLTFGHNRVHVVVTNQRVMLVQSIQMMCGFSKTKGVNAIPVGSLVEAGWAKQTVYCCIHTRAVTLKSKTQTYNLVVKKINDQQMREFMTNASGTITANALAGTAT